MSSESEDSARALIPSVAALPAVYYYARNHSDLMEPDLTPLIREATFGEIAEELPDLVAGARGLGSVETASRFAVLLTAPELQANCIRLEAMVHLALTYCEGAATPTVQFIERSFRRLGEGYCGRMEDPSEDVFVSLVNTPYGNFRVFEGIKEGAGFYLQGVLDIVEGMPTRPPFDRIRHSVGCLLRLSEAVAARARTEEYGLGEELPLAHLPRHLGARVSMGTCLVCFSGDELAHLGILTEGLQDFIFDFESRSQLRSQRMGNSDLERWPLVAHGGVFYLLLPTAIPSAIIRFVIDSVSSLHKKQIFELAISHVYSRLFDESGILGKRLPGPIEFDWIPGGAIGSAMAGIDSGRFLHLVFIVDGLDGFTQEGLNGQNPDCDSLSKALHHHVERASETARKTSEFRDGITLVVGCGYGRGYRFELDRDLQEHWRLEAISAYDLVTLNFLRGFEALSLWRLLESRERLEQEGTHLLNVNGLLNLVAWSSELDGHLVPYGSIPNEFGGTGHRNLISVRQNALRDLRHRVMREWDPRRLLSPEGNWVKVRRLDKGEFEEDNLVPLYGSEQDIRRKILRGVFVAPT